MGVQVTRTTYDMFDLNQKNMAIEPKSASWNTKIIMFNRSPGFISIVRSQEVSEKINMLKWYFQVLKFLSGPKCHSQGCRFRSRSDTISICTMYGPYNRYQVPTTEIKTLPQVLKSCMWMLLLIIGFRWLWILWMDDFLHYVWIAETLQIVGCSPSINKFGFFHPQDLQDSHDIPIDSRDTQRSSQGPASSCVTAPCWQTRPASRCSAGICSSVTHLWGL